MAAAPHHGQIPSAPAALRKEGSGFRPADRACGARGRARFRSRRSIVTRRSAASRSTVNPACWWRARAEVQAPAGGSPRLRAAELMPGPAAAGAGGNEAVPGAASGRGGAAHRGEREPPYEPCGRAGTRTTCAARSVRGVRLGSAVAGGQTCARPGTGKTMWPDGYGPRRCSPRRSRSRPYPLAGLLRRRRRSSLRRRSARRTTPRRLPRSSAAARGHWAGEASLAPRRLALRLRRVRQARARGAAPAVGVISMARAGGQVHVPRGSSSSDDGRPARVARAELLRGGGSARVLDAAARMLRTKAGAARMSFACLAACAATSAASRASLARRTRRRGPRPAAARPTREAGTAAGAGRGTDRRGLGRGRARVGTNGPDRGRARRRRAGGEHVAEALSYRVPSEQPAS